MPHNNYFVVLYKYYIFAGSIVPHNNYLQFLYIYCIFAVQWAKRHLMRGIFKSRLHILPDVVIWPYLDFPLSFFLNSRFGFCLRATLL